MASKEPFKASSMPKVVLARAKAKVPDFSTAHCCADENYCLPMMMNISPSSSILDQVPPLEEFFGQGAVVEKEA